MRVHARPDPLKLEALSDFVAGFGYELPDDIESIDSQAIRQMLEWAEERPEYQVISQVTLRSMTQAKYSMTNHGHFGLAAPTYCHFTSPIRRYPDLVVHRLLRGRRAGRVQAEGHRDALEGVAEASSELERNAESAERELLAWKKVAFIEGSQGEEFQGVVTGVARFGLFIQLTENLVEGLVRVDQLGDERFEFNEARFELRGSRSGSAFRLGDRMRVRIDRVDRILRRVDLSPVDPSGDAASAGSRRARRSGRRRTGEGSSSRGERFSRGGRRRTRHKR